jgi:hypothetical protein
MKKFGAARDGFIPHLYCPRMNTSALLQTDPLFLKKMTGGAFEEDSSNHAARSNPVALSSTGPVAVRSNYFRFF